MTINKSAIDNYISDTFPRFFADEVSKNAKFISMLRREPHSNAKGPQWQVKVTGHSNAGRYVEHDPLRAASEYTSVKASLGWAQYNATIKMTGLALDELNASGPMAVENFLNTQMEDASQEIAVAMNTDSLAGDNSATGGFVGLTAALSDSGTYAGISRSTYANWQTYQETSGGGVSLTILNTASNTLEDTRLGRWSVALTSRTQEQALVNLSSGAPSKSLQINNGQTAITAVLGAGTADPMVPRVFYNGRPVISIPGYTSGRIDLVDFEVMYLEVLRDLNTPPKIFTQGDDWYASMMFRGQLVYRRPRLRAASITGLS